MVLCDVVLIHEIKQNSISKLRLRNEIYQKFHKITKIRGSSIYFIMKTIIWSNIKTHAIMYFIKMC